MHIIVFGLNHKTSPIEIREKLFLNSTQQDLLLSELKNNPAVIEACVLSTCTRVEVYVHVIDLAMDIRPLVRLIFQIKKVSFTEDDRKYFYTYSNRDAISHLLEVSTGLDSLVLGEEQILGQVKVAFERLSRERRGNGGATFPELAASRRKLEKFLFGFKVHVQLIKPIRKEGCLL